MRTLRKLITITLVILLSISLIKCGPLSASGPDIQVKSLNSFTPDSGHVGDTVRLRWTPHESATPGGVIAYFQGEHARKPAPIAEFPEMGNMLVSVPEGATTGRIELWEDIDESLLIEYRSQGDFTVLTSN